MTPDHLVISRAALTSPAAEALIGALNAELSALYPEPGATHFSLMPAEVEEGNGAFLIGELAGVPVGCGAVRRLDGDAAELKRMYVAPAGRGRGIGRRLLEALETEARRIGVRRLLLETGIRQHAARALYARAGYTAIPAYGEYVASSTTSICLGKSL